jgi:hypothetical protein
MIDSSADNALQFDGRVNAQSIYELMWMRVVAQLRHVGDGNRRTRKLK